LSGRPWRQGKASRRRPAAPPHGSTAPSAGRSSPKQLEIPGTPAPAPRIPKARELPKLPRLHAELDLPAGWQGRVPTVPARIKFRVRPAEGKIHAYLEWQPGRLEKRRSVYLGSRRISAPPRQVEPRENTAALRPLSSETPARPSSHAARSVSSRRVQK